MRTIRGVNCCVVGGAGFLGSHLVDHLVENRDCQVLVIDNLCAGRKEFVHPKATFIHADITQSESYLYRVFRDHKIEYVFNYSSWPYIPDSFARPSHVCNANFMGAINVINAASDLAKIKGILQVSSAEIYGEGHRDSEGGVTKIPEWGDVEPHSSYGVSKAAVDSYVQCRWREARTPCIALRQFNCVGERETHPYVIPEIISQIFHNGHDYGNLSVYLGNNSVRDFMYAGDAVRIAVELLERGEFGEVYNLGSESGVRIHDLPQMVSDLDNVGAGKVRVVEDAARKRPWEIWALQACCDKINKVVEARPVVSLKEALRRTVAWYTNNGKRWPWETKT